MTHDTKPAVKSAKLSNRGPLKRFWRNVHLWLGIGLFILLVPIGLSGATLVYHDDINDRMYRPQDTAKATGPLDLTSAVNEAMKSAGKGFRPTSVNFPDDEHSPISVSMRGPPPPGQQRGATLTAYLDQRDGHLLNLVDFRASLFGFMHVFHENLTLPQYSGRDIVGWGGVAMLILALTGLYLWWPRRGQWSRALAWRRSPATSSNLHYLAGFWICFPLALISFTGVYLAWPQQGRSVLSSMAEMTPQPQRGGGPPQPAGAPSLSIADVYKTAAARPNATITTIFYPNAQQRAWRIRLDEKGRLEPLTLLMDDQSRTLTTLELPAGDRIAQWIRWLHEGSRVGEVWRFVVFVAGIMPTLLGVTGILVWLRQRRQRAMMRAGLVKTSARLGETAPAE